MGKIMRNNGQLGERAARQSGMQSSACTRAGKAPVGDGLMASQPGPDALQ